MRKILTFLLLMAVADALSACVIYERPYHSHWHEGWRR